MSINESQTPLPASVVEVETFAEAREAWKCPHLSADIGGPGEHFFHAGTVMRLDGDAHLLRRRTMGALLKRRGHKHFRDTWLFPTASAALSSVLEHRDEDGMARVELLGWTRRVNQRLAAALVGFDDATSEEDSDALFDLVSTVMRGRPDAIEVTMNGFDEHGDAAQAALIARQEIVTRYFDPALARRQRLAEALGRGELEEADLPHDLLMLIARDLDPAWRDRALAEREALFLLMAGVHTTSATVIWTLREIFAWLAEHPEQVDRITEEAFILRAGQETMRLHPVVAGFARAATQDVTLSGGTTVPEGSLAVIRSGPASTDTDVYGDDAATFNPDRPIPAGVHPFGFAFGMGPHMCFGAPLVMGSEGLDGSLVHLLRILLRAGVRPDPDANHLDVRVTHGAMVKQVEFPVVFPARGPGVGA